MPTPDVDSGSAPNIPTNLRSLTGLVKGRASAADPPGDEEYLVAAIDAGTSTRLSDLESLLRDVTFARSCLRTYLDWKSNETGFNDPESVVPAALWSAAVISYRRAFNSGKALGQPQASRLKVPDDWAESLDQDQLAAHEQMLAIASKHVAHRVSDHEVAGVRALLTPPPLPREVVGIVTALGHVSEPTEDLPEPLIQICTVLIETITESRDALVAETVARLRRGDVNPFYDAAVGPIRLPESSTAGSAGANRETST